jgi:hypothetical protein
VPAANYEIRVKGRLSDRVTETFADFSASLKPAETVMRGPVRDQPGCMVCSIASSRSGSGWSR